LQIAQLFRDGRRA